MSSANPISVRNRTLLAIFAMSAAIGCGSTRLKPSELPGRLLAQSATGQHHLQLRGMTSVGEASTAIGPGDLLEISVLSGREGEEVAPIQTRVSESGVVEIPLVGAVTLAGVDPAAGADVVAAAAVDRGVYVRPQVNIVVAEQATSRVTVLGAVAEPGVQEVPRTSCDVLTAIAYAGGFTEEAGTVVEVLRHNDPTQSFAEAKPEAEEGVQQASFQPPVLSAASPSNPSTSRTEEIDLADLQEGASPSQHRLADRDVIVIRPKEKRLVHVTGLVHKPDQFEIEDDHDLRVLDAIAMAGGVSSSVADKVIVIRHPENEPQPVVVEISLMRAKRDGTENLLLQSGDLVSVETTVATAFVETFKDLFRITMGVGGNLTLF